MIELLRYKNIATMLYMFIYYAINYLSYFISPLQAKMIESGHPWMGGASTSSVTG